MGEIVIGAVWIWGLASLPEQTPVPLPGLGRGIFWLLVVAHSLEVVAHYDVLRDSPGSMATHVAQTFLWGDLSLRKVGASP